MYAICFGYQNSFMSNCMSHIIIFILRKKLRLLVTTGHVIYNLFIQGHNVFEFRIEMLDF